MTLQARQYAVCHSLNVASGMQTYTLSVEHAFILCGLQDVIVLCHSSHSYEVFKSNKALSACCTWKVCLETSSSITATAWTLSVASLKQLLHHIDALLVRGVGGGGKVKWWLRDCQSHGRWILPRESLMSAQAESLKVVYCRHPALSPSLYSYDKNSYASSSPCLHLKHNSADFATSFPTLFAQHLMNPVPVCQICRQAALLILHSFHR